VSDKTAVDQPSTSQLGKLRPSYGSGTLQPADQSLTRDQLRAAERVAERHAGGSGEPESSEEPLSERDTEPSIDAQILREALRQGLSK